MKFLRPDARDAETMRAFLAALVPGAVVFLSCARGGTTLPTGLALERMRRFARVIDVVVSGGEPKRKAGARGRRPAPRLSRPVRVTVAMTGGVPWVLGESGEWGICAVLVPDATEAADAR